MNEVTCYLHKLDVSSRQGTCVYVCFLCVYLNTLLLLQCNVDLLSLKIHRDFVFCLCACCRNWEALKKWDEAIQLTPEDALLYEMKSQVKTESHFSSQTVLNRC